MSFPVLGLDPGFANLGYAVVLFHADGHEEPVRMGVFRTDKSTKKQNVLAADDNLRRAREIVRFLRTLAKEHNIKALCAETMSYPRNSSTAAKMSLCWGAIAYLSEEFDIPIVQATPQSLKKSVAGKKTASKTGVQRALYKAYGKDALKALLPGVAASLLEHPYDALGAVAACRDSEVLRIARKMTA